MKNEFCGFWKVNIRMNYKKQSRVWLIHAITKHKYATELESLESNCLTVMQNFPSVLMYKVGRWPWLLPTLSLWLRGRMSCPSFAALFYSVGFLACKEHINCILLSLRSSKQFSLFIRFLEASRSQGHFVLCVLCRVFWGGFNITKAKIFLHYLDSWLNCCGDFLIDPTVWKLRKKPINGSHNFPSSSIALSDAERSIILWTANI